jgi:hypothetical protein
VLELYNARPLRSSRTNGMPQTYTVRQGDHMFSIARQFGFSDYHTIWDQGENAELKKKRVNPNVLYPGDVLYIPDKQPKTESVATAKVHRFEINAKPLKLRLTLRDFDNMPVANMNCELEIEGQLFKLKSNGDGFIEQTIPADAHEGVLKVPDMELEIPVKIGYLDPKDEDSGWQARLINLGYHPGPVPAQGENDDPSFRKAIEEFQCDYKLKVTGEADAATKAKLTEIHGC